MFIDDLFTGTIGLAFASLIGLMVGSFLNVVIYRLPVMIDRQEKQLAWEILHGEGQKNPSLPDEKFNLLFPNSHCPKCKHKIRAWENIPVISYLLQKGKCRGCGQKISPRYMGVEILTALASGVTACCFQTGIQVIFALLFTWTLIALIFIDAENFILPDVLTLPLMWLGIFCAVLHGFSGLYVSLPESVLGAMVGYVSLWLVYWIFKIITKKEGMGFGDFKLLAALCAWQGAVMLPIILFFASISGIIYALISRVGFGKPIPFGPYLAVAGWLSFLFGRHLLMLFGFEN
ncbi:MAG: prepilin peptidase [Cardiobacteriaceae bacterium]|nr:prepilin peptidase [Cardiobacteriaceae bacterium]